MRIVSNQVDFHRVIDQSLIVEPNSHPISDALNIFCGPGEVHEVRATDTNLLMLTGWFDDLEAISHAILDLTRGERRYGLKELMRLPESVYFTLNLASDDLLALVGSGIKTGVTTTKDHEILAINRMYLDGDPWRSNGFPSRYECHSLTSSKKIEVRNYLIGMGFPHPCQADSGNGAHLMLAALLNNSPDDRALVEEYIKAVPPRFGVPCKHGEKIKPPSPGHDDMIINIAAAVFSPARIVTTYGAMKRKGTDIPRRPHRISCTLNSPGELESVERGVIPKVVADLTLKNRTTVIMAAEQSPRGEAALRDHQQESWSDGFGSIDIDELWAQRTDEPLKPIAGFDLTAQLEEMGVLAKEPKIAEKFTYYPVKECPFNTQHRRVVLSQHRSGTITYLCPHYSCQGKKKGFDRKTARDYFAYYGVMIPGVS